MTGKLLSIAILLCALIAGAGMYYAQVYAYYETVVPNGTDDVRITASASNTPEVIPYADFQAIDSVSSPIRYRACFTTTLVQEDMANTYVPYPNAAPRIAPGWFDCFDAKAIGALIESGEAEVFVGERNLRFGIDRVVAITRDGRGYVWHEINDCGDKEYDGTPKGTDCPEKD